METGEPYSGRSAFQGSLDVPLDLPLAGVGSRAVAHLLDLLLLQVVAILGLAVVGGVLGSVLEEGSAVGAALMIVGFFVLQWGGFFVLEWVLQGQTPGKRLFGLRIVTTEGGRLHAVPALIRNLLRPVDFLPGFYGFGILSILASPRQRRLGDLAAGTVVIREDTPMDLPGRPRWPEGFRTEDIVLVERWFQREAELREDRREALAADMLAWLERDYPDFVRRVPEHASPSQVLWWLFFPAAPDTGTSQPNPGGSSPAGSPAEPE